MTNLSRKKQLENLKNIKDDDIDYSDIPEITSLDNAEISKFYKPIKKPITIRLDADIIEWFKRKNEKYQTALNDALREYIKAHR
ncbi:MAG: BrnA antitoxin family protein [Alphaproteobacteria bacterium]